MNNIKSSSRLIWLMTLCAGVGGILYGYDIGVISGALIFIKKTVAMTPYQEGLLVGAVLGGGLFGTLIAGYLADKIGRRPVIMIACLLFFLGISTLLSSNHYNTILAARLLLGLGVGVITVIIPLYLSEIAPAHMRGKSVTIFQLFLTSGIVMAYLVDLLFTKSGNWHGMFAVLYIPTTVLFLGIIILPETPRWLLANNKLEKASAILAKLYPQDQVQEKITQIQASFEENSGQWRELITAIRPLSLAIFIAIATQFTGINIFLQYAPMMLQKAGLSSAIERMVSTLGVGVLNLIATAVALMLIDKVGRRKLLLIGTSVVAVITFILGSMSHLGHLGQNPLTTIICMFIFIVFFAIGPGVVVWLAISELLPTSIRGKGVAICLGLNSLTSAVLSTIYPSLVNAIGIDHSYWVFSFTTLAFFLVALKYLPETKGKSLEEIQAFFQKEQS